jgi:hypothetical protein
MTDMSQGTEQNLWGYWVDKNDWLFASLSAVAEVPARVWNMFEIKSYKP